ncbi:DUF1120 domain-containing protein [Pantoea dispersa]|uniref:DUF1120 domain-containing protein n=1 Tax=Pantoea dispersa TaxID=59814 RepID=UPI001CA6A887|nr:DUF1120 domain-containing protein [Pantoea dispersa]QZY95080.1 DUF1120 domain-containing protein [Pantoea dispersa]
MMKNMMKTACAIAVLAASANVMAESVDLTVKGTIAPIACKANIAGGGVIDYGVISPESLKADAFTNLPKKTTNLTVTCDSPAKIAIGVSNNRVGSILDRPEYQEWSYPTEGAKIFDTPTWTSMGLGMANGKPIGAWGAMFENAKADGAASKLIVSYDKAATWGNGWMLTPDSGRNSLNTMSKTDETAPVSAKVFSYDIVVESYINKSSTLDLTKPIALDGSATLELVYL